MSKKQQHQEGKPANYEHQTILPAVSYTHLDVYKRQAMYAIREMAAVSLTQIGDVFGGRDHTTVMHSIHKVEDEMKVNPHLKSDVDEIMANIKAAGEY